MSVTISPAYSFLKFLDQPVLVEKLGKAVPILLPLAGAGYVGYETLRAPQEEKKKTFIKNAAVMAFTVGAALLAPPIIHRIFPEAETFCSKQVVDNVLRKLPNLRDNSVKQLLIKAKDKILTPFEVHRLRQGMHKVTTNAEKLVSEIIPDPKNLSSADIRDEIGALSLLGLFPVLGGLAGGVVGNMANRQNWRGELKNQAKEGLYQYLANIFLCNVGAYVAIKGLEKLPNKAISSNRWARIGAMTAGIAAFGIIGGSSIANFFGKNFFNPLFDKGPAKTWHDLKKQVEHKGVGSLFKNLNEERHPELMDVGLHADDMATVGVLSGLRWIEPILPFLYSLSGYRTGIGYRNGKQKEAPRSSEPIFLAQPSTVAAASPKPSRPVTSWALPGSPYANPYAIAMPYAWPTPKTDYTTFHGYPYNQPAAYPAYTFTPAYWGTTTYRFMGSKSASQQLKTSV